MNSTEAQRAVAARVRDLSDVDGFSEVSVGHTHPATIAFGHGKAIAHLGDHDGQLLVALGTTGRTLLLPRTGTTISAEDVEEAAQAIVEYLRSLAAEA